MKALISKDEKQTMLQLGFRNLKCKIRGFVKEG